MMEIGALGSCTVSANALRGSFLIPAKFSPPLSSHKLQNLRFLEFFE